MLYLVMSNPDFSKPSEISEAKKKFIIWLEDLKSKKKILMAYPKIGKGSVVLFDVESNSELNSLINEWLEIVPVPVTFEFIPLVNMPEN